jgi:hypothetical protein
LPLRPFITHVSCCVPRACFTRRLCDAASEFRAGTFDHHSSHHPLEDW